MADPVHPDTGADVEMLVEQRLAQCREVPGLLEWDLPLGTAWLRLQAEGRPLTIHELAAVVGWRTETIARRLAVWGVTPDSEGAVTAVESDPGGVSLPRYRIRWLDGHTVVPVEFFVRLQTRFFARALAEAIRDEPGERTA